MRNITHKNVFIFLRSERNSAVNTEKVIRDMIFRLNIVNRSAN